MVACANGKAENKFKRKESLVIFVCKCGKC
jgi:hypothetical protein